MDEKIEKLHKAILARIDFNSKWLDFEQEGSDLYNHHQSKVDAYHAILGDMRRLGLIDE